MSRLRMHDLRRFFGRIKSDESGLALVEFAVLCPVLLVLYLGGVQLCETIACARKVTSTARAVSDLTTQYSSVSPQQVDAIMSTSTQIMYPYDGSKAVVRVSELRINNNGVARVVWSRAVNGVPRKNNSKVSIDANLATPGTMYIFSEVEFKLTPVIPIVFKKDFHLSESFVMLPRISTKVNCSDC